MKNLQEKVKKFCEENNLDSAIEYRLLDTLSELGEVSKEILEMTNYGRKKMELGEEIKSELGDVFYSLITVANSIDIDLESALEDVLKKYERRLKRGGAGSEND